MEIVFARYAKPEFNIPYQTDFMKNVRTDG